ncbi:MAG: polyprenyl synthetase family protein [Myxococcota bacterium]|nr:polyprenyl synthetase family protein [Myxococcota bacterium]
MSDRERFVDFLLRVRLGVESLLVEWLDARVDDAQGRGAEVGAMADAIRHLALRGGKRMRAVLLAAAYEGCGGEEGAERVVQAGAALELLQVYLLVHDDWMDGDEVRRGGPSVPAVMRGLFGAQADAASILAGDLAAAWAHRAMLEVPLPAERVVRAMRELARVEEEVVQGQLLDVRGFARDEKEVEVVHALKTASYSVRGPVMVGAVLAGASDDQLARLAAFAEPLGVAFQLRDDVLGTFGHELTMGKPSGGDLREGKRTALVVEAMRDPQAAKALAKVLGHADASEAEVRAAAECIEASGSRRRVEERILVLVAESLGALERADLTPAGRAVLAQAALAMTERQH